MKDKRAGRRLLLSSPLRRFGFGFQHEMNFSPNIMYPMNWVQIPFHSELNINYHCLDMIAINLSFPVVVMHFPSRSEFIKEVKKRYEYIGLSFVIVAMPVIKEQIALIRKYSPQSKIILGGFGTLLDDADLEGMSDYVCRGDGIAYMKELFHEQESTEDVSVPLLPVKIKTLSINSCAEIGIIFQSIGCPNGCEFCSTTHLFKQKKRVFVKSGRDLYEKIISVRTKHPAIQFCFIFNEDYLEDISGVREYLECVRKGKLIVPLIVYSTMKSISQFTDDEIVEMGIRIVWIGVEGLQKDYAKLAKQDFKDMVTRLQKRGVAVIVSHIMGYDYQTIDIISREHREIIAVSPYLTQLMIFTPCPGTSLRHRLEEENRINKKSNNEYGVYNGFSLLYRHPTISRREMEKMHKELQRREYNELGPSVYRYAYIQFQGYLHHRNSACDFLREHAQHMFTFVKATLPYYRVGILFAKNKKIRIQLCEQYKDIMQEIGGMSIGQSIISYLLLLTYVWTVFRFTLYINLGPTHKRREYNISTRELYKM